MAHMEHVLDLYAEPHDPQWPVVCFDETSTQLLAETRPPMPAQPGRPRRQDYEYRREGTHNLFLACEPLVGWGHVAVTQRRTMQDFANQMRWLVDETCPEAEMVRVVLDNLNTHRMASLYETFPAPEVRRDRPTAGVSLHPQARELAEYGGNRVQRAVPLLHDAASPRRGCSPAGGAGPGPPSAMLPKPSSTGGSTPAMPEPNSTASIPAILNMTDHQLRGPFSLRLGGYIMHSPLKEEAQRC